MERINVFENIWGYNLDRRTRRTYRYCLLIGLIGSINNFIIGLEAAGMMNLSNLGGLFEKINGTMAYLYLLSGTFSLMAIALTGYMILKKCIKFDAQWTRVIILNILSIAIFGAFTYLSK